MKTLNLLTLAIGLLAVGSCSGQQIMGIGVALGKEGDQILVKRVLSGSPAARTEQLNLNDRIIAVAQDNQAPVEVSGMDLTRVVQMIRGPQGTAVHLTIVPAGKPASAQPTVVKVMREPIRIEAAAVRPQQDTDEPFKVGDAAPDIEGEDVDGHRFKLSDYKGKVAMIDFWGDW